MKQSQRNVRNAIAKAEKRSDGKPALSKYERKTRGEAVASAAAKARGIEEAAQ